MAVRASVEQFLQALAKSGVTNLANMERHAHEMLALYEEVASAERVGR